MRTILILSTVFLYRFGIAQDKPCLPDSLQYDLYATKINEKDTTFRFPTNEFTLKYNKSYHYRDCLNPNAISKIRQVFRGEIDYLPQYIRNVRKSYNLASDTPKRVLKIKQKYPKDSLATEMAIDTLIKESSMKNINFNITRSLKLPRTKLILTIGQIYLKEMIPDLEWAITQDSTIYPPLHIKLALARMGNKKYQDYFLENFKDFVSEIGSLTYIRNTTNMEELNGFRGKIEVLEYINTQESWDLLLQENLSENIYKIVYEDGYGTTVYERKFIYHPKFPFKNLEAEDQRKYNELFFGPKTRCYSYEGPDKVWDTCPKEMGLFLYNLHHKYIKNFVMPYNYFER